MSSFFLTLFSFPAISLFAGYAYVADYTRKAIEVINLANNSVITTVSVSGNAAGITISPNGLYGYILQNNPNIVSVIKTQDYSVVGTFSVGSGACGLALTPDGNYAYIANATSQNALVVRTSDYTTIATLASGSVMNGACVSPNGNYAYLADATNNTIRVVRVSDNTIVANVTVGTFPCFPACSPDSLYVYSSNYSSNNVSVIRTTDNQVVTTLSDLTVMNNPINVATSSDGTYIYVISFSRQRAVQIRTSDYQITRGWFVGFSNSCPYGMQPALTLQGQYLYVPGYDQGIVTVIDTTLPGIPPTITVTPTTGPSWISIAQPYEACIVDNANSKLFLGDLKNLTAPLLSLSLGSSLSPKSIALTQDFLYAYITQNGSDNVSYLKLDYENIFPSQVLTPIPLSVSSDPGTIVRSPDGAYMYVTDTGLNAIWKIVIATNTATQIADLSSIGSPNNLSVSPDGNYLVVTIPLADKMVVIQSPSGTPSITQVSTGASSSPNAVTCFTNSDTHNCAMITCSGTGSVLQYDLTAATSVGSVSVTSAAAISKMTISGNPYFLVAETNARVVSLVQPGSAVLATSPSIVSTPSISRPATQIAVNLNNPTVAYLLEPSLNQVQSIDFTSSIASPTVSSVSSVGNLPVAITATDDGSQVFVLNYSDGTATVFPTSGGNQQTLGSPTTISGLGSPQGISFTH